MTSLSEMDQAIKEALGDNRTSSTQATLLLAGAVCQIARAIIEFQEGFENITNFLVAPDSNRIKLDVLISDLGLTEDRMYGGQYLEVRHSGAVKQVEELP